MKYKSYITKVKSYLKSIGMSQETLALKLDVSRTSVVDWLNGKYKMPNKYMPKLLEALEIKSLDDIKELPKDASSYTDITKVKSYLKSIGMSRETLALKLDVTNSSISNWLNGKYKMPNKYMPKLLEALEIKSLDDIKELPKDISLSTDITKVKPYLKNIGMSQEDFALKLDVSRTSVGDWLNGKYKMPNKYMPKLLEALEIKSLDDIKELPKDASSYTDITKVKSYLKSIGMSQETLALKLDVSRTSVVDWLNGKYKMPNKYMPKLLEALKIKSLDDIKELPKDVSLSTDITKVKPYLKNIGMSQEDFALKLDVSRTSVVDWLNGKREMSNKYMPKLLEALGIKSLDDIKNLNSSVKTDKKIKEENHATKNNKNIEEKNIKLSEIEKTNLNKDLQIEFKKYDIPNDIFDEAINETSVSEEKDKVDFNEDIVNSIDTKKLFEYLKQYIITKEQFKVIILIFTKKVLSADKIKQITSIDKSEIFMIFNGCLKIYNEQSNKVKSDSNEIEENKRYFFANRLDIKS